MDRISTPTKALDLFGVGKHGFRDGNLGSGILPTDLNAAFFNDWQEEMMTIIEANGFTPTAGLRTQVYQAIQFMIATATSGMKVPVRYTTTANVVLSGLGTQAGGDWPGAMTAGDRVLVKDQATGADCGIYVAAAGPWVRATDADGTNELFPSTVVSVQEGTAFGDSQWMQTTDGTITIGTTALVFARKDSGLSTSNFTGSNQSKATSGYQKLPGGLIIQWGYVSSQIGQASVTWPIAFPNALFTAVSNVADSSGSLINIMTKYVPAASGLTSGTFMLQQSVSNATASGGYSWIAIGW
ncbi:MAG: hypothetical protein Q8K91_12790 [Hylemonella sp.]|nr:hypothetical protein [Hylemonella sp.]MDP1938075.1 hypothetical protein [Hylemonella sp.]